MGKTEKRTCLNCGEPFTADARNARHQRYCTAVACKAASKRASQANWLAKPENRDYHRGPEAVARVQAWRAVHPGYSRRQGGAVAAKSSVPETSPTTITESAHASLPGAAAIGPGIGGPGQGVAGSPSRVQPTNAVAAGAGTRRLDHGGRCRNHPTASVRTDAARTAGADIL